MKKRPGFTIIELLTIMIIVGLLAVIAISRFWSVKERSYESAVKSDLRNIATQQERYFSTNFAYATTVSDLPEHHPTQGVTVSINWTATSGWAATASHASLTPRQCGFYMGPAPAGTATPATESGAVACN